MADRAFPVSETLNAIGRLIIRPHIKIQSRDKGVIPSLYFHDDTNGRTGKIRIGLIRLTISFVIGIGDDDISISSGPQSKTVSNTALGSDYSPTD